MAAALSIHQAGHEVLLLERYPQARPAGNILNLWPHTARQVQQAYALGKVFHHAPAPLRLLRDLVLEHTPFLQKVVGDSSPGEIVAQLDLIDRAEARFAATPHRNAP